MDLVMIGLVTLVWMFAGLYLLLAVVAFKLSAEAYTNGEAALGCGLTIICVAGAIAYLWLGYAALSGVATAF